MNPLLEGCFQRFGLDSNRSTRADASAHLCCGCTGFGTSSFAIFKASSNAILAGDCFLTQSLQGSFETGDLGLPLTLLWGLRRLVKSSFLCPGPSPWRREATELKVDGGPRITSYHPLGVGMELHPLRGMLRRFTRINLKTMLHGA